MNTIHALAAGLVLAAAGLVLAAAGYGIEPADAQSYPAKTIRIVVPFPAGGPTDVQSRWAAQRLNQALGQPVVVDNRPGAGGITGSDVVAKAPADGYTLVGGNPGPLTVAPSIQPKMPYQPERDFAPVTLLATAASMLCVHPSVPARNVQELIALAKRQPGKINYASPGVGTVGHFATELFNAMAGVKLVHVPYKGAAQYVTDLLAGHIDAAFVQVAQAAPYVRDARLRALGVAKLQRAPQMPEVPTIHEQGLTGYQSLNWTGLLAPAGTPREVIARLNAELVSALRSPAGDALTQTGFDIAALGPQEYADFLKAETAKWAKVAKAANITLQ
ncbi:MAG: tripartite tricarboxylate transporter substrate binding protein [Burkholderiales bacterium]|nr:tripartite tricarboxylate transporter substrate binding protein [Burkholderiales bacterium]